MVNLAFPAFYQQGYLKGYIKKFCTLAISIKIVYFACIIIFNISFSLTISFVSKITHKLSLKKIQLLFLLRID